jgi:hypothetical protein
MNVVYWEQIAPAIPEVSKAYFEHMGRQGKAPRALRVTKRGTPFWDEDEVQAWLVARHRSLGLVETIDGEVDHG